jgi:hypothetical protein
MDEQTKRTLRQIAQKLEGLADNINDAADNTEQPVVWLTKCDPDEAMIIDLLNTDGYYEVTIGNDDEPVIVVGRESVDRIAAALGATIYE